MKRIIIVVSVIGGSILLLKIGDVLLRYTNDEYRSKKQIEAWDSRIEEFEQRKTTEKEDGICYLKIPFSKDTLEFEIENITEEEKEYDVEFVYPIFKGNSTEITRLNEEIELMVFDELSDSKTYFSEFRNDYIEEFEGKEEEIYNWRDLEEIELVINNDEILVAIHSDFELKSGGAIWFGEIIGFNYDIEKMHEIVFEEIIDTSKMEILQLELQRAYKKEYGVKLLKENDWEKEEIPVSENFYLDIEEIVFLYQRFEHQGIGGSGLKISIPYCQASEFLKDGSILEKILN